MNENDLVNNTSKKNTYRATTNLNTAIENPQINMDSVVGVNIKDIEDSGLVDNSDSITLGKEFDTYDSSNVSNYSFQPEQNIQSVDSQLDYLINNETNSNSNYNSTIDKVDYVPTTENMNDNVVYEPIMKEKKNHDKKFTISREFKVIIFIVFILLIFILLVPYIYDFLKELELRLSAG